MSTQKKFAVDEKIAQKNLVLSLKQKGDWKKIKLLGEQGNTFARKAYSDHEWALAHPRPAKVVKKSVEPVVLIGPAAAGKHGGGKEAPALPQTESKKTNKNRGPAKGPSGTKTSPNSARPPQQKKKGGKNKGNKKDKK